jgi:hypothetical protein
LALKWGAVIPTMGLVSLDGAKIHELDLVPHEEFVVVRIRLFASSSIDGKGGMPVYLVVAGEENGPDIRSA